MGLAIPFLQAFILRFSLSSFFQMYEYILLEREREREKEKEKEKEYHSIAGVKGGLYDIDDYFFFLIRVHLIIIPSLSSARIRGQGDRQKSESERTFGLFWG